MKKELSIIIAAGLVLASCTGLEDTGDDRILFESSLTRTTSDYNTSRDFGSYAWKTGSVWASTADADKIDSPYMANVQTTYIGSLSSWVPGSYCWPTAASYLHFACYAPYSVSSPMTFNVTDGIMFEDWECDGATDLLYSDFCPDQSSAEKPKAGIKFNHALCRIVFKPVKGEESDETVSSVDITLKSITLSGIKGAGTFVQLPSAGWSGLSGSVSYTAFSGSAALTETAYNGCTALYLIPQPFENGVQKVMVGYEVTVHYKGGTSSGPTYHEDTKYLSGMSLTQAWEAGKSVIYTLTITRPA